MIFIKKNVQCKSKHNGPTHLAFFNRNSTYIGNGIQTRHSIILVKNTKSAHYHYNGRSKSSVILLFYGLQAPTVLVFFLLSIPLIVLTLTYTINLCTQSTDTAIAGFQKSARIDFPAVTRRSTRWQKSIAETIPVIWAPKDKTVKISPFKIETFHPLPPLFWFESNPSFPHYPPCRSKSHTGMAHSPHGRAKTNHEARCLQLIGMNQMFGVLFD